MDTLCAYKRASADDPLSPSSLVVAILSPRPPKIHHVPSAALPPSPSFLLRLRTRRYILNTYKLAEGAAFDTLISTAIKRGADKGNFALPKGPSGKVTLNKKPTSAAAGKEVSPVSSCAFDPGVLGASRGEIVGGGGSGADPVS